MIVPCGAADFCTRDSGMLRCICSNGPLVRCLINVATPGCVLLRRVPCRSSWQPHLRRRWLRWEPHFEGMHSKVLHLQRQPREAVRSPRVERQGQQPLRQPKVELRAGVGMRLHFWLGRGVRVYDEGRSRRWRWHSLCARSGDSRTPRTPDADLHIVSR